jgi:pimeloyl-ACP methyl ester carboxylesterase
MSVKRVLAAVVPLTVVLAGLGTAEGQAATGPSAAPAASGTGLESPGVPAALNQQALTWSECYPGAGFPEFECAGVQVPKDWSRPAGDKVTIAVSRIKASDPAKRRGVLFTNPGGPGGSGLTLSLYLKSTEPEVAAAYDLIGIDPRGVGSSVPALECAPPGILSELYGLDGRNVSPANQRRIADLSKKYAETCASAPLTRYITTDQTARDFDLIRAVLKERKVSYVGYSAGTWLGTWYAALFPLRVDRFLLDGNLDFTSPSYESALRQPGGFQKSFEKYLLPWIASHHDVYRLGSSAAQVKKVYEARRAALAAKPLTLGDGTVLTAAGYDSGIVGSLYWTGLYEGIATALSDLELGDTASSAVTDFFGGTSTAQGADVFWAVACQDDRSPSYRQVVEDTTRFRREAALAGANWNAFPCSFWPGHPKGSPVRGRALPKLLMINNDADPATPLGNAAAARAATPNARLVTVKKQPDHTIYGSGDGCVEEIANAWLLRGALPARDTSCPGLPLPKLAAAAARVAPGATSGPPARIWMERFLARHGRSRIG